MSGFAIDDKSFPSFAPGFWSESSPVEWNNWKWQLRNRVMNLEQLERLKKLYEEGWENALAVFKGDRMLVTLRFRYPPAARHRNTHSRKGAQS